MSYQTEALELLYGTPPRRRGPAGAAVSADRLAAALRELLARTSDDVNRHLPAWVEAREALAEHAELHERAANEHDAQEVQS